MAVRGTLQGSKALKSGFGIQEGNVRVTDARFKIVQHSKKDGTLVTPYLALQLDVAKLDDQLQPTDITETKDFIVAWGSKEAGDDGMHKFRFRPAKVEKADDDDIEDLGCEIDTEGNTFCSDEGGAPFEDSEAALFMKSLEAKGWKPEINDQAFSNNYINAAFKVKTADKADLCNRLGVKYKAPSGDAKQQAPVVWEVTQIHERPYEKKKAGKTTAAAKSVASTSAPKAEANGDSPYAPLLAKFTADHSGQEFSTPDFIKKLNVYLTQNKIKMQDAMAYVTKEVKPKDNLVGLAMDLGWVLDEADNGAVTKVTMPS